jgi:hypothetical protein
MSRRKFVSVVHVSPVNSSVIGVVAALSVTFWVADSAAYKFYSEDKNEIGFCAACHGEFSTAAVSLTEGEIWPDALHIVHRDTMLSGDCDTCHGGVDTSGRQVNVGSSGGGNGLVPIACAGCHGRAEDFDPAGTGSEGYGAGLRQHHWVANRMINGLSTRICLDCHVDADPANFTPVDESVLPPYYAFPAGSDLNHVDIPSDPCNPMADGFPEDYAGSTEGLDNDGDGLYDENDINDIIPCPEPGQVAILLPGIGALLLIGRCRQRSLGDLPASTGPDQEW